MNIAGIESDLRDLVGVDFDPATFALRFLEIYDAPRATITKLRQGSANQATAPGDVLWKHKLFFRAAAKGKVSAAIGSLSSDALTKQHKPRFILATDGIDIQCRDVKADQNLDIEFGKLNDRFDFFLPLAGIERYEPVAENPADVKAAGQLAKLYDAILEANPKWAEGNHTHELNLFMARMLFCFFAESTSIFENGLFSKTIFSMSNEDGSDTASVLQTVFMAMDRAPNARGGLPEFAKKFPYVNGGLFAEHKLIPTFSAKARRLLRECGKLSWQDINPDIFGSMIQAVVEPGLRGDMGMHYTSVPNILKVLRPLFLLSLEAEFEIARDSAPRLQKLLDRIYSIRVFDPACGSGNFLIIAYRELRKLENRIFDRLKQTARQWALPMTGVKLNHFYGIELTDFAAETAKLSLWIAEYQMNEAFKIIFGAAPPALPLREGGNIIHDNATRLDWLKVGPTPGGAEIYVVGNPPYLGRAEQTPEQKADIAVVFSNLTAKYKSLDYVACWIAKSVAYCQRTGADCGFVTTNSICQGEQVALLWPLVYRSGLEIGFAYESFKWRNNAAKNAGVTCVIVGLRVTRKTPKVLYDGDLARIVSNIGPYLTESDDTIVTKKQRPLSNLPKMDFGSMANDEGGLILSPAEAQKLISDYPGAKGLIRRLVGSQELIKGIDRRCLWITDDNLGSALLIPPIAKRIEAVRAYREESRRPETQALASSPHKFGEIRHQERDAVVVPKVSSEQRPYLPVGSINSGDVVTDLAFAIYNAPIHVFAILSSRLHLVWTAAVGGQLETRLRYSNTLVYNTFPLPELSSAQRVSLEDHALAILGAREAHPGKTMAWLYDLETMPNDVLTAHRELDEALEEIYIGRAFRNDTERLAHLFKLYSVMTSRGQTTASTKKSTAVLEVA
jgi:hypothetical protein